jgi:hypothetical protein
MATDIVTIHPLLITSPMLSGGCIDKLEIVKKEL